MQIHELTKQQLDEGLLDLAKQAAGGVKGAVQGYKDAGEARKIAQAADKAYTTWTKYSDQVAKTYTDPVKKQAYLNRQDGRYEKDLLSFVQQNLLRGLSFSTLNNRDDIMGLIKAISKATASTATPPAKNPYNNQLAGGQATTTVQGQPVKPGAVPSTATPLAQAQAAAKKPTAPATTTTPATPVKEAVAPAQIKQLFTQLVQQTALAQQSVYTGQQAQQPTGQPSAAVDPKQMAAQLSKILATTGLDANAMRTAGQAIMTASGGNPNVRSTGNPAVDMLLKQMGFSI
jgi:hypothetical protein